MIPHKRQSPLKQFMLNKPLKHRMKVRACDSYNGYVLESQVYVGKSGSRGVKDLSNKVSHQHYHVYFDNFFSSPLLLVQMYENGLYGCGTMRIIAKDPR